ncbi:MAG: D-glycero-alpha-D-manno-heptose-1,7-bisphosphate 7-phosphatase [Desulfovibrionaceae bacterium]
MSTPAPSVPPRRFVLLDRDGTLMEDRHYLADPAGVALVPGAAAGLRALAAAGLGLVVVSNQSGVGRGYFTEADVAAVNGRLAELLAAEGVVMDGWYHCPHGPDEGCACRKPAPGLALAAARDLGFDPARGFVVGDKSADVDLARAIGAAGVLVLTGKGEKHRARCAPDFVARDLAEAADWILARLRAGA